MSSSVKIGRPGVGVGGGRGDGVAKEEENRYVSEKSYLSFFNLFLGGGRGRVSYIYCSSSAPAS